MLCSAASVVILCCMSYAGVYVHIQHSNAGGLGQAYGGQYVGSRRSCQLAGRRLVCHYAHDYDAGELLHADQSRVGLLWRKLNVMNCLFLLLMASGHQLNFFISSTSYAGCCFFFSQSCRKYSLLVCMQVILHGLIRGKTLWMALAPFRSMFRRFCRFYNYDRFC